MIRENRFGDTVTGFLFATIDILQVIVTLAMATIAGFMVIGGIGGTVALMAGSKSLAESLPAIGWVFGGVIGLAGEVSRLRRRRENRKQRQPSPADSSTAPKQEHADQPRFRFPSIGQIAKSIGLGGVFGTIGGIAATIFLGVLLISVTTSPFVPNSWRPKTHAPDAEERRRERTMGRSRDGVSTNFTHPLLAPLAMYTTGSFAGVGLIAGAALAFFEDETAGETGSREPAV